MYVRQEPILGIRILSHSMAHEFCTLFDRNYLVRGLVLYRSLVETGADFNLRVFCMDTETAELLGRLALASVEVVTLAELESLDPELAAIRGTRSHLEYMWTATPAVCLASFARDPALREITYLDADLRFSVDPQPLFDEIGDASITIISHRYAPRWRAYEATSGIYNVEWLTFRRDVHGVEALEWWRERCLEWCRAVAEDGKFGDQAYLDDWPERFEGVHVLEHPGAGVAPWNLEASELGVAAGGGLLVDGAPLVFFHHHGMRLIEGSGPVVQLGMLARVYRSSVDRGRKLRWRSGYPLDPHALRLIWEPYMVELLDALDAIRTVAPSFAAGSEVARLREVLWVARSNLRTALRGGQTA
jgi:hypothetical protein